MTTYYVYKLIDPRDGRVFYVGKGKGQRMYQHEKEARRGKYSRKCKAIREIIGSGAKIRYEIDSHHKVEADAYARERELIDEIGLCNLTNVIPGGGGAYARPVKPTETTWAEAAAAIVGIARCFRTLAAGYEAWLANVNLTEMAKKCYLDFVKQFGSERVNAEFLKHGVQVA